MCPVQQKPRGALNRLPWPLAALLIAMACVTLSGDSGAATPKVDPVLARSEGALGRTMGNYRLLDHDGEYFPLYKLKGSPILISFMYIDCNGPCHLINQSIKNLRGRIDPSVMGKMTVLSITLDTQSDSPARLKEYGFGFSNGADNWIFATADRETVDMIVKDLGFDYNKAVNGFDHMNRLTLIGPDGVVLRHFYGVDYDPKEVESAARAAISGSFVITSRLAGAFNSIMLSCSAYDPLTKTYKLSGFLVVQWALQYLLVFGTLGYYFRGVPRKLISSLFHSHPGGHERNLAALKEAP